MSEPIDTSASVDTSVSDGSSAESSESPDVTAEAVQGNESGFAAKTVAKSEVKAPAAAEKKIEAPKPPAKKFKLKIDGAEEELDEETVLKLAQMGRASNKRFQEAAQKRKEAEDVLSLLKKDLEAAMRNPAIGIDPEKWAEDLIYKKMQRSQLSPEQLKIQEYETKLKAYEDEKKQQQQVKEQEEFKQLQKHHEEDYALKIKDALAQTAIPKTAYTVKRMAEYMQSALRNKIDLEPIHVARLVRQDYMNEILALTGEADGDALLSMFGEGVANKIRKADLKRLSNGQFAPKPAAAEVSADSATSADEMPKKTMNVHEWREWQANRFKK